MNGRIEELHIRLEDFGRNLTQLASMNKLAPIYGRDEIVSEIASQLSTRENNILLVGEPGTGKNAIVEALACRIHKANIYKSEVDMPYKMIVECTPPAFQSFCLYAHEFETKISMVINEIKQHNSLLFMDHINLAITAGSVHGAEDRTLANILNPHLSRNDLTILGSTTPDGYKFMMKKNPSFVSKFIYIEVPVMTAEETIKVLRDIQDNMIAKYSIAIPDEAIIAVVEMSDRFYPKWAFPGKAFSVLKEVLGLEANRAREIGFSWITKEDVYHVFKKRTGLPEFMIYKEQTITRDEIEKYFEEKIYGQNEAVEEIVNAIICFKAELNDSKKPVGAFLFAGPTGVGKTYLAQLLAQYLFGSEDKLLRYDMAEYSTFDSAEKLIGGIWGERKGKLVEEVLANPFSVILFDEIEKAHPNIFNLLLSVLGEGRLADSGGQTVFFHNSIIIMTSNIGAELYGKLPLGIRHGVTAVGKNELLKKIQEYFRPEFINRLTKIVPFKPLTKKEIKIIAKEMAKRMEERRGINRYGIKIGVSDNLLEFLVEKGYHPEYGVRPMQRAVEQYVGIPLAEAMAEGRLQKNTPIYLDIKKKKLHIRKILC